jgi:hypothetical protein
VKRFVKYLVIKVFRTLHSLIKLDVLSTAERNGFLNHFTSFKLVRKSFHNLPFSEGLTVRGAHFGYVDPFCRALFHVEGEIDEENFSNVISHELFAQIDKKVKDFLPASSGFPFYDYPLYSIAFPWDSHTYDTFKDNYLEMVLENRREHLSDKKQVITKDYVYSNEFVASHLNQFNKLLRSIQSNGFNTHQDRPRVLILKEGNRWKWMMSGQGNHRAYLLSMLKYEKLPCEIVKVVDKKDVEKWSNVKNGIYTKDHALEIFDLIFSGRRICKGIV